jgi:CubicO group peptidase (beta-lactamase class C family)
MRSIGPAGLIIQSAGDLLAFARLHLDGGVAPDGKRLLSAESAAAMRADQVRPRRDTAKCDALGLAWRVYEWGGRRLVGHDGGTLGQQSYLRVDPEARLAVCLLTNSPDAPSVYQSLVSEVLDEYVGVRVPEPPEPTDVTPERPERHVGRYERAGTRFDISDRPPGLLLRSYALGDLAQLSSEPDVHEYALLPLDESGDRYAFRDHDGQPWATVTFGRFIGGGPYVSIGGRTTPKVEA